MPMVEYCVATHIKQCSRFETHLDTKIIKDHRFRQVSEPHLLHCLSLFAGHWCASLQHTSRLQEMTLFGYGMRTWNEGSVIICHLSHGDAVYLTVRSRELHEQP